MCNSSFCKISSLQDSKNFKVIARLRLLFVTLVLPSTKEATSIKFGLKMLVRLTNF